MMRENVAENKEFYPSDEELKKVLEFNENDLKEFPERK
jgi:hypothetical protein